MRHPVRWLHETTGDGPMAALLVLFGINAVDELARVAIAVSGPTIADSFGVGVGGVAVPFVLAFGAALGLAVPIATIADRGNRVRLAVFGGIIFSIFSVGVGLSWSIWVLAIAMAGMQIGKAFIEPSHTSLLSDYYPVELRPRVFAFYRGGNALGALVGAIAAGYVAEALGWRAPFFAFALPMLILVAAGARLPEPRRGLQERRQGGAEREALALEEAPPSLAEAWRMCWQVDSLRRIYRTLPFLTPALIGFALYGSFAYRDVFGLDTAARGWVVGLVEGPSQLFGLIVGTRLAMRAFVDGPAKVFHQLARALLIVAVAAGVFAAAPVVGVAIAANVVVSAGLAFVVPGLFATLSLVLPPRARSTGFALASVFVLAGLLTFPVVGLIANSFGMRWGIAVLAPVLFVGGLVVESAGDLVARDIMQVWAAAATRTQALAARAEGRSTLLLVQGLDVFYGDVQVLSGVGIEAGEGEIVALLGTNGAGKSTLLQAIAGLVPASKGAVILDGRDITYAPAHEVAPRGVALVPGGWATFPSLTVADNLRAAGWAHRQDRREAAARVEEVLAMFPPLRDVLAEPAANLSGGQQHMLGLSMALLARPRLLLIDELSLGLAPVVVDRLVEAVRRLARARDHRGGGRAVAGRGPDPGRAGLLPGQGQGPVRGPDRGPAGPARPAALDLPGPGGGPRPHRRGAGPGDAAARRRRRGPGVGARCRQPQLRRDQGRGRRVAAGRPGRGGRASSGPTARASPRWSTSPPGSRPATAAPIRLHGRDVTHLSANGRARRGLGRSFQAGRLFPGLTVETCLAVAVDRWGEVTRPAAARPPPARGLQRGAAGGPPGRRAGRPAGAGRLPPEVRARAVHRHPPGGGAGLRDGAAAQRGPAGRAGQRPGPARGGGAGPAAGAPARPARRQPGGGRARHAAGHRRVRPAGGARPRAGGGRGPAGRRAAPSRRCWPRTWGREGIRCAAHDDRPGPSGTARATRSPSGARSPSSWCCWWRWAPSWWRAAATTTPTRTGPPPAAGELAEGAPEPTGQMPITYAEAPEAGTVDDYDWGDRCDTDKGTVRIPTVYATPCVPVFEGDNGGATAPGVTADTIRIVLYVPQATDLPSSLAPLAAAAEDSPEEQRQTLQDFFDIYASRAELYGRRIELVAYRRTGALTDVVAARADAAQIAAELKPFAVLGGPQLDGGAFAQRAGDATASCASTAPARCPRTCGPTWSPTSGRRCPRASRCSPRWAPGWPGWPRPTPRWRTWPSGRAASSRTSPAGSASSTSTRTRRSSRWTRTTSPRASTWSTPTCSTRPRSPPGPRSWWPGSRPRGSPPWPSSATPTC